MDGSPHEFSGREFVSRLQTGVCPFIMAIILRTPFAVDERRDILNSSIAAQSHLHVQIVPASSPTRFI